MITHNNVKENIFEVIASSVIWSHPGQILNFKKIDPGQP